jgi:putative heme utilization carrier protein HutX
MLDTPKADLVRILAEDPSALFERVVKEQNVTLREVILALPHEMRSIASGERFIDAMKEVATWGEVTVIIHTDDGIMEFTGPVPNGEVGRGYYNLMSRTGFHGHLRHERCAGIAFVERPFMSRPSASLLFLNLDGGVMFKVFVGRDEKGALKEEQLGKFRALAERLGAVS